jgi:serine/threonine-protein kinase HipA
MSANYDYLLYDLINTRLHVDETDFALDKGLFTDGYQSEVFKRTNHPTASDFTEFGKRINLPAKRIEKLLIPFRERQTKAEVLIFHSFLSDASKRAYQLDYNTKRNNLNQ